MPDRRELVLLFAAAATSAGLRAGDSRAFAKRNPTPQTGNADFEASEATLAELRNDALDPRDYGAVGDGTTNDQTALQNCLTDAASLGKPVFIRHPGGREHHQKGRRGCDRGNRIPRCRRRHALPEAHRRHRQHGPGPMDPRGAVVMQGITVFGAHDVTVSGNTVDTVEGAGIVVASWDNRGITERVQVVGNTVRNASSDVTEPIRRFGALRLFGRSATNKIRHITVVGSSFQGNKYGVEIGQFTEDILVDANFIDPGAGSTHAGILVWNVDGFGGTPARDIFLTNNSIAGAGGPGIDVDYCTGLLEISGNKFRDINTSRAAGVDVIRISANVAMRRIEIVGNEQMGSAQTNTHKFIELGAGISAVAERNYSEAGLANDAGA